MQVSFSAHDTRLVGIDALRVVDVARDVNQDIFFLYRKRELIYVTQNATMHLHIQGASAKADLNVWKIYEPHGKNIDAVLLPAIESI